MFYLPEKSPSTLRGTAGMYCGWKPLCLARAVTVSHGVEGSGGKQLKLAILERFHIGVLSSLHAHGAVSRGSKKRAVIPQLGSQGFYGCHSTFSMGDAM